MFAKSLVIAQKPVFLWHWQKQLSGHWVVAMVARGRSSLMCKALERPTAVASGPTVASVSQGCQLRCCLCLSVASASAARIVSRERLVGQSNRAEAESSESQQVLEKVGGSGKMVRGQPIYWRVVFQSLCLQAVDCAEASKAAALRL